MKKDYKTVRVEVKDGVAILALNNPPVNQLSAHFVQEMADALLQAGSDKAIKAVILTGTGRNFIAGADITEIQTVKDKNFLLPRVMENHRFINSIEDAPKPVIAAINGNCLGGGLEIAMACHYRIAAQGVQIGQPEVQIGLIPGAGGTQRLPRLIGFADALQMITTGNPISAEEGAKKGALDEVVGANQLLDQALKVARRFISGEIDHKTRLVKNKKDKLPKPEEKGGIIAFAKGMAAKQAKGYIAPFKAIEALERGLTDNFEADLKIEAELFTDCVVSDVAKNLIGVFLNTRAAGRLPRIEKIEPKRLKKVGMLGGGVMGSGIINLLLSNGFDAVLWDINDEAIRKGVEAIRKTYAFPIKKGKMTQEGLDKLIKEHLVTTTSLETLKDVDLVIEAVLEDLKIKTGYLEAPRRDLPAGRGFWNQHLGAAHHGDSLCPFGPRPHDRTALLQPCGANATAGDHLRQEDLGSNPIYRRGLWPGHSQGSHRGERWTGVLCLQTARRSHGRIHLHAFGGG